MSEQAIKKLLLFWWSYYSKVTYTKREKDIFECFIKSDSEKTLQMAIEAHVFGFENAHIIQDIRENPDCFMFQLTDYPTSNPSNPDYENIKADFLKELTEKYIENYVKDRLRTSTIKGESNDLVQTLTKDARASLGLPRNAPQNIDVETLLLYWWKHYNQITTSEKEDKMFHTIIMQDEEKALQLAIQTSTFWMNPQGLLLIIQQNKLDEVIAALPKVKSDPDFTRVKEDFLEQLTMDYLDETMGINLPNPPPINWGTSSASANLDLTRKRKEQEKNGN